MRVSLRAAACLAAVLAGASGCGDGGDGAGGLDRQDPVSADAVLGQVRPGSAGVQKVDTVVKARLEGEATGAVAAFLDTPLELHVTGRGDTTRQVADLDLALDAGVLKAEGRYVADGTRSYAQLFDAWYVLPDTAGGVFPAVSIALLERPDGLLADGAQVIGTESVDGVECDVVEGPAEPEAVADRLAGVVGATPVVGAAVGLDAAAMRGAVQAGTARVWIGREDKAVHRVRVDATVDLASTSLGTQGLTSAEISVDGRAVPSEGTVEVTVPADARPLEELQGSLGGLLPQGTGS